MKWIKGLSLLAVGLTIIGLCVNQPVIMASKPLSVLIMVMGALFLGLGFCTLGIKTPAQEQMEALTQEDPEPLKEDNLSIGKKHRRVD